MQFIVRQPWDLPQALHTPETVYENRRLHRREFLTALGLATASGVCGGISGCSRPTDEEIQKAGAVTKPADGGPSPYPAPRNDKFEYGRTESVERKTAEYTNFYEFSTGKDSWKHVGKFQPNPWQVEVSGLCAKPRTFDFDELLKTQKLEERHYRHRCVETWAMCVPWTGFRLRDLLKTVEPLPSAKFVAFETFNRPAEAPHMAASHFPWPYQEGLTLAEATNELTFLATGIYGHALPKQNGAPVRLVLPWKYGFKSIKSLVKIVLTDQQPATFWNSEWPVAYDFTANVDPDVPHPNWSQRTEWMLGTREVFETQLYNGYGKYVAELYA
jgi:sulfoxide reductase catalytic subunit YedY